MTSNNDYDKLSFCLNILYDFVYNKNTTVCYKFEPISNKSTTVNDLKKKINYIDDNNDILQNLQFLGFSKLNKSDDICTKYILKKNQNYHIHQQYLLRRMIYLKNLNIIICHEKN